MKKLFAVVTALSLLLVAPIAHAADIKADATITSVIVYPDRAMVTRAAEFNLKEGEHTIVFENLPANIDTDSLRPKGSGDAQVRIFSIESKRVILERPREEQIAELEEKIQDVRDEIAALDARIINVKNERKLVHSIGAYAGEQFSKEFITRQPNPEEWTAMVEFQRKNLARLSEELQQSEIKKRELSRRLDALLRQLDELRGQSQRAGQEVRIDLAALTPGTFKLLLSCVVHGASWYSTYDARADLQKETVEISYIGNVRQNTGEDWSDVDVSLSTARPAIGAKMPEIRPWYLRQQQPIYPAYEAEMLEDRAMMKRKAMGAAAPMPAKMAVAEVVQKGTSVQFKIQRKMNIPSDNAYHRTTILAKDLPAKLSYASTPRLSPFAYLTAKLTNTTGAHWLPGKVSVFVDGDFIGTSNIKPVARNEEITLDLGIDEGIKIKREQLVRKQDETRIFGKKKERRFKDKISIENHKSKAVELLLIDHIPVSQHDDIDVSGVKFSLEPTEQDAEKGIVKWKLPLAPSAKKEITIEFTITHPLDMIVSGL